MEKNYKQEPYPSADVTVSSPVNFRKRTVKPKLDSSQLIKTETFERYPAADQQEKAEAIATAIGNYVAAYVARHVHMAGRNEVAHEALMKLAETIAAALK